MAAATDTIEVETGAGLLRVAVRRSTRARRIRITAEPGRGVEVVAPVRASGRAIVAAVREHAGWIARQERRLAERRAGRLGYDRPGWAWLDGEPLPIDASAGATARAHVGDGRVVVRAPDAAAASEAILRLYRREAAARVHEVVAEEAERLGRRPTRISVRDTRARWGSCSSRGAIALSWRLVLAPPAVLRYVAVHELCHLGALHHGPAFWAAVDAAMPGWRDESAWLREHGWELLAHRPRLADAS